MLSIATLLRTASFLLEADVRLSFSCFVYHVFIFGFQLVDCHMPQCLIFMLRFDFDTIHLCFQDPGVDMPVLRMSSQMWQQGLLQAKMFEFCAALPPSVIMVDTCAWISYIFVRASSWKFHDSGFVCLVVVFSPRTSLLYVDGRL